MLHGVAGAADLMYCVKDEGGCDVATVLGECHHRAVACMICKRCVGVADVMRVCVG